jgi:NAD(P)-dependent dehydrogenase (short-subunit alcohol dehydrogenase family)
MAGSPAEKGKRRTGLGAARRLRGKIALVTGASRGIGLAIADTLAAEGCAVVITGRNQALLKKAAAKLAQHKVPVLPLVFDVRDAEAIDGAFAAVRRRFGRLNILVNNAGVAHAGMPVGKLPQDAWTEVIETNLTGLFLVTRAALSLIKRGGVIVNNLSIAAKKTFPGSAAYNASKHGALGFTNTLREELREQGIRVIALLPGATDTDIWNTLWPEAPRKKMMSPKTVAQALMGALFVAENSTVEELTILPSGGTL